MTDQNIAPEATQTLPVASDAGQPAAPAPVAQPATPAPAAPEAPVPAVAPQATQQPAEAGEYAAWHTGDAGVDGALGLLAEAGVAFADAQSIFKAAIDAGDPSLIDRETLSAKVGPQKAAVITAAVQAWYQGQQAQMQQVQASVYAAVPGGEAGWNTVREWAKGREADPEFAPVLAEVRKMMDAGPVQAVAAAQYLHSLYSAAPGTNGTGNTPGLSGRGTAAGGTPGTIPRAEYIPRLREAYARGDHAEVARLNAAQKV